MTNQYEENDNRIVEALKATQSYKDANPFKTYYQRRDDFESFLHGPDGLPNCGCGNPEDTLTAFMDALDYCALKDVNERSAFLKEKFGVKHVTDDRLVQLLFYVLDDKSFIEHNYTISGSYLTNAGKALRAILIMYLNGPTTEQVAAKVFDIDFDTALQG